MSLSFVFLLFFAVHSTAQNRNPSPSCSSSSCGGIRISFPYRLKNQPKSCGYSDPNYELDCRDNHTTLTVRSRTYSVQEINYDRYTIRLVDPAINTANLSSCPAYSNGYDDWDYTISSGFFSLNSQATFVHCRNPVDSPKYVEAPFCGNRSGTFSNSSEVHGYVVLGENVLASDLEDSCTVDKVVWASAARPMMGNSSWAEIYDGLGYGFELTWFRALCGECERTYGYCSLEGNKITCRHYCREDTPVSELGFRCKLEYYGIFVLAYGSIAVGALLALRFVLGFPILVGLVVYKWKRRHLAMDETVEEV